MIDISGDGPNNSGPPVTPIRDELVNKGIVINGLPIFIRPSQSSLFDISYLDRYYADCVIGGPGSFMIPIRDKSEFATATRQKLLLEISALPPPPQLIPVQFVNEDEKTGIDIIRRAIEAPIRQIASNSGVDGAIVIDKVRESKDVNFGFNADTLEYGDMLKFGVIDPTKVVRSSLMNAASVSSLLLTTDAIISEIPEKKEAPKQGGEGMGDEF